MGRRKTTLKLPKTASIICPKCKEKSIRKVPEDSSPQYFDCDKCSQRTQTPITSCCIICAFTKKNCIPSLLVQARAKGLEIK